MCIGSARDDKIAHVNKHAWRQLRSSDVNLSEVGGEASAAPLEPPDGWQHPFLAAWVAYGPMGLDDPMFQTVLDESASIVRQVQGSSRAAQRDRQREKFVLSSAVDVATPSSVASASDDDRLITASERNNYLQQVKMQLSINAEEEKKLTWLIEHGSSDEIRASARGRLEALYLAPPLQLNSECNT